MQTEKRKYLIKTLLAAQIAVQTVRNYRKEHGSGIEVIFNVWKDIDYEIYRELLG